MKTNHLTPARYRRCAELSASIIKAQRELDRLMGQHNGKKRVVSEQTKKHMAASARRRWAKSRKAIFASVDKSNQRFSGYTKAQRRGFLKAEKVRAV